MSFGRTLLARGAISAAQLDEATQCQVVFGGRLGTNLVELGYLGLDELEDHLSHHLGVPCAPREWLERPDRQALALLSPEGARRHRALPLRCERRTLHAALADPLRPDRIDELAFATGLPVRPYVIADVRLDALLEHHYGIPRDTRTIHLGVEAARGSRPGPEAGDPAERARPAPPPPDPERDALGIGRLEEGQELIDEKTFSSLHTGWEPGRADAGDPAPRAAVPPESRPAAPPPEPLCVLEAHLACAPHRDAVAALALADARRHVPAAALFLVRAGALWGLRGDGDGVPRDLSGIVLSLETDCMLTRAAAGRPVRGAPGAGLDARLLAALGRSEAREILTLPVHLGGHVVNLLYADAGPGPLGEVAPAALGALCARMAAAYERLILERKRALTAADAAA